MALTTRGGLASALLLPLLALACSGQTTLPGNSAATAGSSGMASGGAATTSGGKDGGGTTTVGPTPAQCKTATYPGRTPLRRLTAAEFNNTVHDILGDTTAPGNDFPPPSEGSGFSNDADAYQTQVVDVQGWLTAAEALASKYRAAGKLTLACSADAQNCATGFIKDTGKKLFRRPLSDAEVTSYLARFTKGSTGATFEEGLEWVLGRMLQSPQFLYRVELESVGQPPNTPVPLNDYSVATRLSYFLLASTPDAELMAAADAHQLSTPEGVAAQVTRLMTTDSFKSTLNFFHQQWVGWSTVAGAPKAATITPAWNAALQDNLIHESELFVQSVFGSGGTYKDLLTATHTFVNPTLAQFYGISYPGTGTDFVRVEAVPHRAGLLTQGSILAGLARTDLSSPVKRGFMIRKSLLCTEPPPPPMISIPPVVKEQGVTAREAFTAHRAMEPCKSCHVLMDPLGLPLENFDEFGRYRDMDQGKSVDATGGLTLVASKGSVTDPALAPINGAADLGAQLAALPETQKCLVQTWFRYAAGHQEEAVDSCTINALIERFGSTGGKLDDLLVGIATSDGFRFRMDVQ
jgi:Protein of unknown function (DUF1592)/Protein of unknown function (DUF1588)/Protein of unknown function (DUF1595)/Protein of unknown function (DUF1587)/Protein of unknown function (DUF1585)